jgi:hypothetical protein
MTSLELTLASILQAMAQATEEDDVALLAALTHRKNVICATLAAPEQSWHVPQMQAPAQEPMIARPQRESRAKTLRTPLVTAGV